jgi:WD40 repeat protein
VDASRSLGVLIGDGSVQFNNFYFEGTWTDGVVPQPLAEKSGRVESPYRGLQAFSETDAAFFFGRETAIDEVRALLRKRLNSGEPVVVSGVSGAGKTSLLRAGVLGELRRAGLPAVPDADLPAVPEAATWPCVVLVPRDRPLDELALRIAPAARTDAATVRQALAANPADFGLIARQAAGDQRLLLIVDQFETVFTQCKGGERQAFITALHSAAGTGAALVIIAIRADLEARLADYPELANAARDRYLLTAMTERQLRLAITGPADKVASSVKGDLVDQLLREMRTHAGQPGDSPQVIGAGVLPLLSHALDQAWRSRDRAAKARGDPLTLADYERTGGIEGAVKDSADRAFQALTAAQQDAAQQVFTRLTATTSDGIDTAVRVPRTDLLASMNAAGRADVEIVLTKFAEERLLTLAAGTVEISHEVLLSAWPLLRDNWLAATHADRAARARLQATVTEWTRSNRDPSFLYTGSRLEAAEATAARIETDRRHTGLSFHERDFLWTSRAAVGRADRRRLRVVIGIGVLAAGLAVALVIATISAGNLLSERNKANTAQRSAAAERDSAAAERDKAEQELAVETSATLASQSLQVADADPLTAMRDSVLAIGLSPGSKQAQYALQMSAANPLITVLTQKATPTYMAFSADSKTLSVVGVGPLGTEAQRWNPATGSPVGDPVDMGPATMGPATLDGIFVALPAAFSPDGTTVAIAAQNSVFLWDMASGEAGGSFSVGPAADQISSLAFSPDGKTLAVDGSNCDGGSADCASLWTVATRRAAGTLNPGVRNPVTGASPLIAFSPDGTKIATTDTSNVIRVWSAVTHQQWGPAFPALSSSIDSIAVSPDKSVLAAGEDNGTIQLWRLPGGQKLGQALAVGTGKSASANSVAFSPDGALLAAGGSNGVIRIWDVATQRQIGPDLSGGTDGVTALAFSPDGTTLAAASQSVRLWSVAALSSRPAGSLIAKAGGGVALTANGTMAVDGEEAQPVDNTSDDVRIWHADGQQAGPADFRFPNPGIANQLFPPIALSPDGKTLATGAADGSVRLWKVPASLIRRRPQVTIPAPRNVTEDTIFQHYDALLAFSPDGAHIAAAYHDNQVWIFDAATGETTALEGIFAGNAPRTLLAISFAPDGNLITVSSTGEVNAWDAVSGGQVQPTVSISIGSQANAAAVSPGGSTLAVGNNDGTIQLWNISTGQQIGITITTGDGPIRSLAFSPDGNTLASDGADGTVRLWSTAYLTLPGALKQLCARIQPTMSPAAWSDVPTAGMSYRRACAMGSHA